MKTLFLATCAAALVVAASTAALAGDFKGASYDWSGGYVGANAGAGFDNSSASTRYRYTGSTPITPETQNLIDQLAYGKDFTEAAFTGGILGGYNVQYGNVVLGLEADINYAGFEGSAKQDAGAVMGQVIPGVDRATDRMSYTADWFGTARGRLGYAFDNVLVYGTGGLAYGKLDIKQDLSATDGIDTASWSAHDKAWRAGWTVGGGIEYAMDQWVLGAEYLYVDLNNFGWTADGNVSAFGTGIDWENVQAKGEADVAFSIARATLKYRL